MPKHKCSVRTCGNRVKFVFPKDTKIQQKWLDAIQRPDYQPKSSNGLCQEHFLPEQIMTESREYGTKLQRVRLVKEAVPCVFSRGNLDSNNVENKNVALKKVLPVGGVSPIVKELVMIKEEYKLDSDIPDQEKINSDSSDNIDTNCPISDGVDKEAPVYNIFNEHCYHFAPVTNNENSQSSVISRYNIEQFKDNPRGLFHLTGLASYEQFTGVFHTFGNKVYNVNYLYDNCAEKEISAENKFFLTLWKLRKNCSMYELSMHFGVTEIEAKVIFKKMIIFLANKWSTLDIWPTEQLLKSYMPEGCEARSLKKEVENNNKRALLCNIQNNTQKHIKLFKFLSQKVHATYMPIVSQITGVCIILCNFKEILSK